MIKQVEYLLFFLLNIKNFINLHALIPLEMALWVTCYFALKFRVTELMKISCI